MAIVKLTAKDSIPDVTIYNVDVMESDEGKLSHKLTAPKMVNYQSHDAYTEFPNGLRIVFYDSIMQMKAEITANYGISWDSRRTMQARGNVIIKNFQRQQVLNTESLVYDLNTRKVSTDDFVKITSPDKIVTGKGMVSDELFQNWIISNVNATIYVNENK